MKYLIAILLPMLVSACGGSFGEGAADNRPILEVHMDDIRPGTTICEDETAMMFQVILANASDTDMDIQELHFRRSGAGSATGYRFWGFNGENIREGIVYEKSVAFPMTPFSVTVGESRPLRFWIQAYASDADGEHVFSLTSQDAVLAIPDAHVDGDFPLAGDPVTVSASPCTGG